MTRAATVLLLLAPLLAACSGGEQDGAKGAYVSAATGVCERARADSAALAPAATPAELSRFVDGTVAIAERARGELVALTPPPADAAELRAKVLDPYAALVTAGQAYAAQVRSAGTDQAKLLPLLGQQPTAEGIDRAYLRSYGLGVCADLLESR